MQKPDKPGDQNPEEDNPTEGQNGPEPEGSADNTNGPAEPTEPVEPAEAECPTFLDTAGMMLESIEATERMRGSIDAVQVREIQRTREFFEVLQQATPEELAATRSVKFESNALARRAFEAELAMTLRIPERTAQAKIIVAHALTNELPTTLETLSEGRITYRHAQIIVNESAGLDAESIQRFEAKALPKALVLTVSKFANAARILRERLNPESIDDRNRAAQEDRTTIIGPAPDAMATLSIYGNAVDVVGAQARIDHIADYLVGLPDETRTRAQIRADVALELLTDGDIYPELECTGCPKCSAQATPPEAETGADSNEDTAATAAQTIDDTESTTCTARGRGIGRYARFRPTVIVTVPVLAMLGNSDADTEPATLDGIGPIPMDQALLLAANAPSFIRLLTHPETGVVLSVGRERYRPPADLAIYCRLRDGSCRASGCGQPAAKCDIDHNLAFSALGTTASDNLACECPKHHRVKHARLTDGTRASDGRYITTGNAWTVEHERDELGRSTGTVIWTSATGRAYRSDPEVRFAPVSVTPPASDNTEAGSAGTPTDPWNPTTPQGESPDCEPFTR